MPDLHDRFRGCLLGLAVGDALGALFEAKHASYIRQSCPDLTRLLAYPREDIWYTDDTQMMIGVAETLIAKGEIVEADLCRAFAGNYVPARGYGFGARRVLEAMEEGRDHRAVAQSTFRGGSFGNGGAMRVAPVGLLFRDDLDQLWQQARLSAEPTHLHPLGIEGAQLLALAVALASQTETLDRRDFIDRLLEACVSDEYRERLEQARGMESPDELCLLGNGIAAVESVPTAIASFSLTPWSYAETMGNVILLGGDTDTMAAMAGAVAGAHLGVQAIPKDLLDRLETSPKGRAYLFDLADGLWQVYGKKGAKP
jgi:poly(ADP-ribose) glycohydrolase ARH3